MDREALSKLGRRLYGKSTQSKDVPWKTLPVESKREWIRFAKSTMLVVVEQSFLPLFDQAKLEVARRRELAAAKQSANSSKAG